MDINAKVRELIYKLAGITLSSQKDVMISNRLQKLKRNTGFSGSVEELIALVAKGEYETDFINAFTTNKTHFFRESFHFEDMLNRVIPEITSNSGSISVYCSAASTGEEPYSIAMTLLHAQKKINKNFGAKILATDIDTNVLDYAKTGIYRFEKSSKDFPSWIKPNHYFKRRAHKTVHGEEYLIKAIDEMKRLISYDQLNLSDEKYPFRTNEFDVIFCRNVLIYFSIEDQNKILKKLFSHLKMGGTLYLGHSENPLDLGEYVQRLGHNIFVKTKEYI